MAVLTVVTLLFLTGLFEKLPEATLAAVVIAAVIELVDIAALRRLYRVVDRAARQHLRHGGAGRLPRRRRGDVRGAGLRHPARAAHRHRRAIVLLVYRASQPHVAELGKEGSLWVAADRHPDAATRPDVLVVRVESGLFFANSDYVKDRIEGLCTDRTRMVVLDAETSPSVDVTAATMLLALRDTLASRRIRFAIARPIAQFGDALGSAEHGDVPVPIYPTVAAATAALAGS